MAYEPGIVIVAQGCKHGYLGDQAFTFDPEHYLVLSVPLPFECETEAGEEEPLLAAFIKVDPATLAELFMAMNDDLNANPLVPLGIYSKPLTGKLLDASVRLMECLGSVRDSRILGPHIVREIIYWVLLEEQGGALRAMAARHGRFAQVAKVIFRINMEFQRKVTVELLAQEANMSLSAFHPKLQGGHGDVPHAICQEHSIA